MNEWILTIVTDVAGFVNGLNAARTAFTQFNAGIQRDFAGQKANLEAFARDLRTQLGTVQTEIGRVSARELITRQAAIDAKTNLDVVTNSIRHLRSDMDQMVRTGQGGLPAYQTMQADLARLIEDQRRLQVQANVTARDLATESRARTDELTQLKAAATQLQALLSDTNSEITHLDKNMRLLAKSQGDALAYANAQVVARAQELVNAGNMMRQLGSTIRSMSVPLLAFSALFFGTVFKIGQVGAEFSQTMDIVRTSLSDMSPIIDGAEARFQKLETRIVELGEQLKFTTSEVAQGARFLAQAGLHTAEVMNALPGVLSLSLSGMLELGRAAEITADFMNAFNLSGAESMRVADVMAKTAIVANTSVEQLANAFSFVTPVAASLGQNIEDVATALAALSNSAIKSSRAGTGLAQILSALVKDAAKTDALMKQYGSSFDAVNPQIRSIVEIIGEFRAVGVSAGDVMEHFGERAGRAMLALMNTPPERLADYADKIHNSFGTALETATGRWDNLSGAIAEFQSKIEATSLAIFKVVKRDIIGVVKIATDAIGGFLTLLRDPKNEALIRGFMRVGAAAAVMAAGLAGVAIVLGTLMTVLGAASAGIGGMVIAVNAANAALIKHEILLAATTAAAAAAAAGDATYAAQLNALAAEAHTCNTALGVLNAQLGARGIAQANPYQLLTNRLRDLMATARRAAVEVAGVWRRPVDLSALGSRVSAPVSGTANNFQALWGAWSAGVNRAIAAVTRLGGVIVRAVLPPVQAIRAILTSPAMSWTVVFVAIVAALATVVEALQSTEDRVGLLRTAWNALSETFALTKQYFMAIVSWGNELVKALTGAADWSNFDLAVDLMRTLGTELHRLLRAVQPLIALVLALGAALVGAFGKALWETSLLVIQGLVASVLLLVDGLNLVAKGALWAAEKFAVFIDAATFGFTKLEDRVKRLRKEVDDLSTSVTDVGENTSNIKTLGQAQRYSMELPLAAREPFQQLEELQHYVTLLKEAKDGVEVLSETQQRELLKLSEKYQADHAVAFKNIRKFAEDELKNAQAARKVALASGDELIAKRMDATIKVLEQLSQASETAQMDLNQIFIANSGLEADGFNESIRQAIANISELQEAATASGMSVEDLEKHHNQYADLLNRIHEKSTQGYERELTQIAALEAKFIEDGQRNLKFFEDFVNRAVAALERAESQSTLAIQNLAKVRAEVTAEYQANSMFKGLSPEELDSKIEADYRVTLARTNADKAKTRIITANDALAEERTKYAKQAENARKAEEQLALIRKNAEAKVRAERGEFEREQEIKKAKALDNDRRVAELEREQYIQKETEQVDKLYDVKDKADAALHANAVKRIKETADAQYQAAIKDIEEKEDAANKKAQEEARKRLKEAIDPVATIEQKAAEAVGKHVKNVRELMQLYMAMYQIRMAQEYSARKAMNRTFEEQALALRKQQQAARTGDAGDMLAAEQAQRRAAFSAMVTGRRITAAGMSPEQLKLFEALYSQQQAGGSMGSALPVFFDIRNILTRIRDLMEEALFRIGIVLPPPVPQAAPAAPIKPAPIAPVQPVAPIAPVQTPVQPVAPQAAAPIPPASAQPGVKALSPRETPAEKQARLQRAQDKINARTKRPLGSPSQNTVAQVRAEGVAFVEKSRSVYESMTEEDAAAAGLARQWAYGARLASRDANKEAFGNATPEAKQAAIQTGDFSSPTQQRRKPQEGQPSVTAEDPRSVDAAKDSLIKSQLESQLGDLAKAESDFAEQYQRRLAQLEAEPSTLAAYNAHMDRYAAEIERLIAEGHDGLAKHKNAILAARGNEFWRERDGLVDSQGKPLDMAAKPTTAEERQAMLERARSKDGISHEQAQLIYTEGEAQRKRDRALFELDAEELRIDLEKSKIKSEYRDQIHKQAVADQGPTFDITQAGDKSVTGLFVPAQNPQGWSEGKGSPIMGPDYSSATVVNPDGSLGIGPATNWAGQPIDKSRTLPERYAAEMSQEERRARYEQRRAAIEKKYREASPVVSVEESAATALPMVSSFLKMLAGITQGSVNAAVMPVPSQTVSEVVTRTAEPVAPTGFKDDNPPGKTEVTLNVNTALDFISFKNMFQQYVGSALQ